MMRPQQAAAQCRKRGMLGLDIEPISIYLIFVISKTYLRKALMNDQSPRIDGYHAHVYYDSGSRATAEQLAQALTEKFAVKLGGSFDEPVGPHPVANLQIIFSTAQFSSVVPWLMLNRRGLNVLIHPLSDDSVRDHDTDGAWLGAPMPLKLDLLSRGYRPELLPSA
jgi:aromatic ring-cleaving dioxygenase